MLLMGLLVGPCASSAKPIDVRAVAVPLEENDGKRTRIGALKYLAGYELTSSDDRFDSISGFELTPDGTRLVAVTDRGFWITLNLRHDASGRLLPVSSGTLIPMLGRPGEPLTPNGHRRDAEDLTLLADGTVIVSFEHDHRIVRYGKHSQLGGPELARFPSLSHAATAPANGGVEALVALPGDRLLALREKPHDHRGSHHGWVLDREGTTRSEFTYQAADGFQPTGATRLKDGRIVLVERRFSMITGAFCRLVTFPEKAAGPGKTVTSTELARFGRPLVVDNFEAVSARLTRPGRALIYVGSDDNVRNVNQRTLLLQLAWDAPWTQGP